MIEVHELGVSLGKHQVVSQISMTFKPGQLYGLVGPNGSGKTSLLRAMCGLLPLCAGSVRLSGEDLSRFGGAQRAERIGFLPQERTIAWDLSAHEIARLGAQRFSDRDARAMNALTRVGLSAQAGQSVFSLSGGQRARVLLARLMATDCPVWLLDEPLTALDPAWQRQIMHLLKTAAAQEGRTVIASLHDLSLAAQTCDQICVLSAGRLVANGAPHTALKTDVLEGVFNLSGQIRSVDGVPVLDLSPHPLTGY